MEGRPHLGTSTLAGRPAIETIGKSSEYRENHATVQDLGLSPALARSWFVEVSSKEAAQLMTSPPVGALLESILNFQGKFGSSASWISIYSEIIHPLFTYPSSLDARGCLG